MDASNCVIVIGLEARHQALLKGELLFLRADEGVTSLFLAGEGADFLAEELGSALKRVVLELPAAQLSLQLGDAMEVVARRDLEVGELLDDGVGELLFQLELLGELFYLSEQAAVGVPGLILELANLLPLGGQLGLQRFLFGADHSQRAGVGLFISMDLLQLKRDRALQPDHLLRGVLEQRLQVLTGLQKILCR